MLEIKNYEVYGLESAMVAGGLPMATDSGLFDTDRINNLNKWIEEYDLQYIIERLEYKPSCDSKKTDIEWHRKELNEIKMSSCKNHAILVTRNNDGEITGEFKIDFKDIHKIKDIKFSNSKGYARSSEKLLHRLIKSEDGLITDHKNRDTYDNRYDNLRICTNQQNASNGKAKGVSFRADRNKWRAYIMIDKKQITLGSYDTEQEAIDARIAGELEYFGEFSPHYNHNIDESNDYGFNDALRDYKRTRTLGRTDVGSGHNNLLKGIMVTARVKYPLYWTKQFQRYHFADIVSSQSTMHRVTKMNIKDQCNEWVDKDIIRIIQKKVDMYNEMEKNNTDVIYTVPVIVGDYLYCSTIYEDAVGISATEYVDGDIATITKKDLFMQIISNLPSGFEMEMEIVTNYLQLKTMHQQRRHHKLPDWQIFCDWIESLPKFKEFCLGGNK